MFSVVVCLALTAPAAEPKTILDELVVEGLEVPGLGKYKLPPPTMAFDLNAQQVEAVVKKEVRDRGRFLDRAPDSPYREERLKALNDKSGKTHGREMNLFFAAHGNIKDLDDHNMLNSLMGMKGGKKRKEAKDVDYLDDADLKLRGVTPLTIKDGEERYAILDSELIEKVKLDGVSRSRKQWVNGSLVTTFVLDPRFVNDAKHPNRWRKILDKETLGPPQPYNGFGGYVKATPIPGTKDSIFIEMHFVFSEPYDWFEGKNLIGARLPMATKENVANLRRKLSGKLRK